MDGRDNFDFNFWPAFADTMLAFILILVLAIGAIHSMLASSYDLTAVQENQRAVVSSISDYWKKSILSSSGDTTRVFLNGDPLVTVVNEPTFQRLTFSSHVLFKEDGAELSYKGKFYLAGVRFALAQHLDAISEIQVEGHADTVPSSRYQSNTVLAAFRAIAVHEFLQESGKIDPVRKLMPVTSYGEYKPRARTTRSDYSREFLNQHNATDDMREQNRRVELRVFFHRD